MQQFLTVGVAVVVADETAVVPPEQQEPVSSVNLLLQVSHLLLSFKHFEQPLILQIVTVASVVAAVV